MKEKVWVLMFVIAFCYRSVDLENHVLWRTHAYRGGPLEGVDIDMFELEKQRIIVN